MGNPTLGQKFEKIPLMFSLVVSTHDTEKFSLDYAHINLPLLKKPMNSFFLYILR